MAMKKLENTEQQKMYHKKKGKRGERQKKERGSKLDVISDVAVEAILFLVLEDSSRGRKSYWVEEPMMEA
jgi:hypothetical protein